MGKFLVLFLTFNRPWAEEGEAEAFRADPVVEVEEASCRQYPVEEVGVTWNQKFLVGEGEEALSLVEVVGVAWNCQLLVE